MVQDIINKFNPTVKTCNGRHYVDDRKSFKDVALMKHR